MTHRISSISELNAAIRVECLHGNYKAEVCLRDRSTIVIPWIINKYLQYILRCKGYRCDIDAARYLYISWLIQ